MADSPIKKVIIKKEDLPAFNGTTQKYSVRYRIVSEDRNRSSHWSPYYSVANPSPEQLECSVTVNSNVVTMVWKQPTESAIKQYDIYFKLDSSNWSYVSSSSSTQFSTLIADSVSTLQVAIQLPTYPQQYFLGAALFTSSPIAV
jgi:hypothetical protein